MLMKEKEKISDDSKDIQENLLKRIKILENDFERSQSQSINFELQLQHQKEKNAGDISWMSKMAKLNEFTPISLHLVYKDDEYNYNYYMMYKNLKCDLANAMEKRNKILGT
ncbi:hypothetical protein Tco_0105639 [Tanacetum coccineum]